jgi:hypothetical protein
MSQMPLLFISHKHSDRQIAEVLARFIYCMWECGVATHPQSPNTTLIVFQCGTDIPTPFHDVLRVNARNPDELKRFTDQLLRDSALFPSAAGAIAPGLRDTHVESLARELHTQLAQALPPLEEGQVEQWPAWTYLRLELPRPEAERIAQEIEPERGNLPHHIVSQHTEVVRSDLRSAQLFGKQSLPAQFRFRELLNIWKNKYPDGDVSWFDSLCDQIVVCTRRGFPIISSAAMREIDGELSFTPVVTRVQRLPFSGTIQFDLYFLNVSDPRALPVTSRMVPIADLFCKRIGEIEPQALLLKDLIQELTIRKRNRVPILTSNGAPLYVIHRSMIEQFIVKSMLRHESAKDAGGFTLADLMADPDMRVTFEKTYVVVSRRSTLAHAKAAMVANEGCADVFVTDGGASQEPVLGLLTNVEIARSS